MNSESNEIKNKVKENSEKLMRIRFNFSKKSIQLTKLKKKYLKNIGKIELKI